MRPQKTIDDGFGNEVPNSDYEIWQAGMKEAYLLLQSRVLGVEELLADYSDEGMKNFRQLVLEIFEPHWQVKLQEWR